MTKIEALTLKVESLINVNRLLIKRVESWLPLEKPIAKIINSTKPMKDYTSDAIELTKAIINGNRILYPHTKSGIILLGWGSTRSVRAANKAIEDGLLVKIKGFKKGAYRLKHTDKALALCKPKKVKK